MFAVVLEQPLGSCVVFYMLGGPFLLRRIFLNLKHYLMSTVSAL